MAVQKTYRHDVVIISRVLTSSSFNSRTWLSKAIIIAVCTMPLCSCSDSVTLISACNNHQLSFVPKYDLALYQSTINLLVAVVATLVSEHNKTM